jgi:XTP/dITP diphosphohydrolase/ATP diphosphatase
MPATLEAAKLGSRAAKVGFDWPDSSGLFAKLEEEIDELRAEVDHGSADRIEAEFGDLLFTAMNLARHLKLDAETALRRTNATFRARFAAMEHAAGGGTALEALDAAQLERLWAQAKGAESKTTETPA